jgi:hypothetical protein
MRMLTFAAVLALTLGAAKTSRAADDTWATVKGQVVFAGKQVPVPEKAKVGNDAAFCLKNGDIFDEKWVVNPKNNGVRNVFVWLKPDSDDKSARLPVHPDLKAPPKEPVVIDQPCCTFIPHVVALRVGQGLLVKNSAKIVHNFDYQGFRNPGDNSTIQPGQQKLIENLKAENLPLTAKCGIHGWMSARVGVFDHPYFAVTDGNGIFEIKQAPAGKLRLMVYHEQVGFRGGEEGRKGEVITLDAKGTDLGKVDLKEEYK